MSIVRRRWPAVAEFWFDEPIPADSVDVAYFRQRSYVPATSSSRTYHTSLIDLTRTEEQIRETFNKATRYEIRRAETKDSLECQPVSKPENSTIREFHAFHGLSANRIGIEAVGIEYLRAAARAGCLQLSSIRQQGRTLVWHSYIANDYRARLLHSASLLRDADSSQRALISRANRYLHWLDMLYFKCQGIQVYDLGGLYRTEDDKGRLRLNPFKGNFGGTRVTEYDGVLACSTLGQIYIWARALRKQVRIPPRSTARRNARIS